MKIEFRGISAKRAMLLFFLLFVFVCVYGLVIYTCLMPGVMQADWGIVIIAVYTCLLLLPSVAILIWLIVTYRKRYILTEKELVCIHGKKRCVIPREAIRFVGCAAFVQRGAFLFLCMASENEIVAFANQNWEKRIQLFGKSRVAKLEQTNMGIWQMQLGVYLKFAKGDKVIKKELESVEQLAEICDCWNVTPVLTGPIILDHPEFYPKEWINP